MAIIQGPVAKGSQAVAYPSTAGETITNRYEMQVTIAPTPGAPVANDILEIGSLPPNCAVAGRTLHRHQDQRGCVGCRQGRADRATRCLRGAIGARAQAFYRRS